MAETHKPAKAYLRSKILNASPMELIIILYEGAIASCAQARKLSGAKQRSRTCEALIKAQNMVRELRNSLDTSRGEIAGGLYQLYSFMINRLIEANVQRKPELIDDVVRMLTELKETWVEAIEKGGGETKLRGGQPGERLNPSSATENYLSIIT